MAWVKARRTGPYTTLRRNPIYTGDIIDAPEELLGDGWEVLGQRLTEPSPTTPVGNPDELLTVPQLKAKLEAAGVEVPKGARKADLLNLLRG